MTLNAGSGDRSFDSTDAESMEAYILDLRERSSTPTDAEIGTGNAAFYSKTGGVLYTKPHSGDELQLVRHDGTVHVTSESDFPSLTSGTHTLEQDTGYIINGDVSMNNPVEYSEGSGLYGINWPQDQITYNGTGDFIQGTNVAIMMRNLVIKTPNGTLLNVSGTQDDRFLVQACAFLMCNNLGTIDGFKVPGFKLTDCTNFGDGVTHTGNPEKIYYTTVPFREASGGVAIDFDSSFSTDYVQIDNSFFKQFNNAADGIRLDPSANVSKFGIVKGCIFDDTVQTRTVNFDQRTVGWEFSANSGIQDSSVRGQYNLVSPTATTINTQASSVTDGASYERIAGTTSASSLIERVSHTDNEFTYIGRRTSTVELSATITASDVNDTISIGFFKNGNLVSGSTMRVTLQGATSVNTTTFGEVEVTTNDTVDLRIANLGSTNNPTVNDMQVKLNE